MLSSRANSSVGIRMAARMMSPPMVGVPCLLSWPSSPRSRTVSPTCRRCRSRMMPLPNHNEMSNDTNTAMPARKVM